MKPVAHVLLVGLLVSVAAGAHPIEPLVTESPLPAPPGQLTLGSSYSALRRGDGTEREVEFEGAAGVGRHGELSVGTSIDAAERTVGAVEVGTKVLLILEGPTAMDLSLAGRVASDHSAEAAVFAGRSLAPGFFLQGRVGAAGAPAVGTSFEAAMALQWAPVPRFLPTVEATYGYAFRARANEAWIVPEAICLIDINHLALKAGVPIGLAGDLEAGVIVGIDWQG